MKSLHHQTGDKGRQDRKNEMRSDYRKMAGDPRASSHFQTGRDFAIRLGYPASVLDGIPPEAVKSFTGVGYYFDLLEIRRGERVLALGCGSVADSFIAALHTGTSGEVIGIGPDQERLHQARQLSVHHGFPQLQFFPRNIAPLPLEDTSVDAIISNGLIHRIPDKAALFHELARVLRPAGRLVLADIVSMRALPPVPGIRDCLPIPGPEGIGTIDQYARLVEATGLRIVIVEDNPQYGFPSETGFELAREYGMKSISLLAMKK